MDVDEAALLAELRAISSSASRFREEPAPSQQQEEEEDEDVELSFVSAKSSFAPSSSPDKQAEGPLESQPTSDVVAAPSHDETADLSPTTDAGGEEVQESDEDGGIEVFVSSNNNEEPLEASPKSTTSSQVPPWKRGKVSSSTTDVDVDVVVAAPPRPVESEPLESTFESSAEKDGDGTTSHLEKNGVDESTTVNDNDKPEVALGINTAAVEHDGEVVEPPTPKTESVLSEVAEQSTAPDTLSTFTGERGGLAQDDDLLAELKAISAQSSGAGRFADEGGNVDSAPVASESESAEEKSEPLITAVKESLTLKSDEDNVIESLSQSGASPTASSEVPPWKRGTKKAAADHDVEVMVAAPPTPAVSEFEPVQSEVVPADTVITSSLPSTFTGERGGAAIEEDLLAELKAISSKSSGGDRFADDGGNVDTASEPVEVQSAPLKTAVEESSFPGDRDGGPGMSADRLDENGVGATDKPDSESAEDIVIESQPHSEAPPKPTTSSVPPWKRGKVSTSTTDVNVVVAAPPRPATESESEPAMESSLSRDATTESGNRFEENDLDESKPPTPKTESVLSEVEQHSAAPDAVIPPSLPLTSTGERGGDALEEDLLAELKAISAKSSGAGRFADESGGIDSAAATVTEVPMPTEKPATSAKPPAQPAPKSDSGSSQLPPWKRGKKKVAIPHTEVEVMVAAQPAPSQNVESTSADSAASPATVIKSSLPSTVQGDRGGTAEDPELLALLRGVSSKSADRFADSDGVQELSSIRATDTTTSQPQPSKPKSSLSQVPPWRRGKKKTNVPAEPDVVISAPPAPAAPTTREPEPVEVSAPAPATVIKSSLPSTFSGDRGGAAEDADLLAELRAISGKSSGDRFKNDEDAGTEVPSSVSAKTTETAPPSKPPARSTKSSSVSSQPPPWKRGQPKAASTTPDVDIVVSAPPATKPAAEATPRQSEVQSAVPPSGGIKSSLPSTFTGERGGSAEDAELLALLKGVSTKSSDRFAEAGVDAVPPSSTDEGMPGNVPPRRGIKSTLPSTFTGDRGGSAEDPALLAELQAVSSNKPRGNSQQGGIQNSSMTAPSPFPDMSGAVEEPPEVTEESLPSALVDKKWKLRKEAYILLRKLLADRVKNGGGSGHFDGELLIPGIDDIVVGMVADNNAGALDAALEFAVDYAEHCKSAGSSDQAAKIVTPLVKGSAFSASRPSTGKLASSLTLKLMEVGEEGNDSVHSVTDVLLSIGLTSRKPKVVIAASGLILQAANDFGAGTLPLASISSSAPKMLSHSNVKVRENALNIVAEICRALGSKAPLQDLLDKMKKAQLSQLNDLLQKQPEPTPIGAGLRSARGSSSPQSSADALAALEASAKELEAKRFAERAPVNIFEELPKTDYSERVKAAKWSEKVAALDIALKCGGEKPYKLSQPSSSANYAPFISEMKKLLSHTHLKVASKAMQVLSMLAEGVGPKLFPQLRPLLCPLLLLSKDKKLTQAVGDCADSMFGNVLDCTHLLDEDDALPSLLDEKSQKNALVRISVLQYLDRSVTRGDSAGPRGEITVDAARGAANLCIRKLDDPDAGVRKAGTECLRSLLSSKDPDVADDVDSLVEPLKSKNSRAYKVLKGGTKSSGTTGASARTMPTSRSPVSKPARSTARSASTEPSSSKQRSAHETGNLGGAKGRPAAPPKELSEEPSDAPGLDEALSQLVALQIPLWDAPEDDGGVLAGLKSAKWLNRKSAIASLTAFCKTDESTGLTASYLIVVKEHTKQFKETNFNVTKAIMELFLALAEVLAYKQQPFPGWASKDGINLAVEKIADKKLSVLSSSLLSSLCVVRPPEAVLEYAISSVEKVKSPLGHESFLKWFSVFVNDFGAASMGTGLKSAVPWLVKECDSSNPKVRKAALSVAGELHSQVGPAFRALLLSSCPETSSIRGQLERVLDDCPFDPAAAQETRPKACVVCLSANTSQSKGSNPSAVVLDLPKSDLVASLPEDCITKMGAKEGKTAWKLRKEALADVEAAVSRSNGLISTEPAAFKSLLDLLRALRERLNDSQSNLKPVAARVIGSILGSVDGSAQARLGKIVFAPLVSAVMNDNRKPMREASLEALRLGTCTSSIEGGNPNSAALESLVVAVVGELTDSDCKAGGLPDLLSFLGGMAEWLPDLDSIMSARAQSIGEKFASAMVNCLTSSKSETRSAAEEVLKVCIENEKLSLQSVKKGMKHLLPAQQRTVIPIISRLPHPSPSSPTGEKENDVPAPESSVARPPRGSRTRKPAQVQSGTNLPGPSRSRNTEGRSQSRSSAQVGETSSSDDADHHPLVATGEPGKKSRIPSRRINWPEHPEEPSGSMQFNALKKFWSPSLPQKSVDSLFPAGGIRKQEDAKAGYALLCKAIDKDRHGQAEAIVDHVDAIFMWTSYALCSRESTKGLQSLITLLLELFSVLQEHGYKLSDGEASILLPHIFEKASISKGRFREQFNEVISIFRSDASLLPTRSFGQAVCVPLIEHSHQAKTRVMAMHECSSCVESIGLTGIGKRGVCITAKALSEESLPENRAAALDLMITVLSKMDGDVQKLASICGTSYLSDKSKVLIEERWKKHVDTHLSPSRQTVKEDQARRRSQLAPPRKSPDEDRINRRTNAHGAGNIAATASASSDSNSNHHGAGQMRRDELPSLKLGLGDDKGAYFSGKAASSGAASSGPFAFSFEAPKHRSSQVEPSVDSANLFKDDKAPQQTAPEPVLDPNSAAAALRARLLKMRQKQTAEKAATNVSTASSVTATESSPEDLVSPLVETNTSDPYCDLSRCIGLLLRKETPVPETDPLLEECILSLRKLHTALSSPDATSDKSLSLRKSVSDHTVETIENLTSIMVFALACHLPEINAGMSVTLLSVALATLMTLFRDNDLNCNVTQEPLAALIREAGKALLDPRLSVSTQLDKSTNSQMVRAINKLAVQAATGSPRQVSLQALLATQLQLCTIENATAAGATFNSRLSRIVNKLFVKVIKAEETESKPFSVETVDVETLLSAMDKMLSASTDRPDAAEICTTMSKSLLIPLIKSRGNGIEEIREAMTGLGISHASKLGLLVSSCENEIGSSVSATTTQVAPASSPTKPASMSVADLVSAVGSAPEGPEREAAIGSLRKYNEIHGDEELNAHLGELSATFRVYIMDQLSEDNRTERKAERSAQSTEVVERLRQLKSKFPASDSADNSFVEPLDETKPKTSPERQSQLLEPSTPSRASTANESRLTPSRIPTLSSSSGNTPPVRSTKPSAETLQTFRERLSQVRKASHGDASDSEEYCSRENSAYGRAAALRARLNAVKQKSERGDFGG